MGRVEEKREEGEDWFEELVKEDRKRQREERWERIRGASFNSWYKLRERVYRVTLKKVGRKIDGAG